MLMNLLPYHCWGAALVVALLAGAGLWFLCLAPAIRRSGDSARRVLECGYLAPPPSDRDLSAMHRTCRAFVKLFVGEIEVVGGEKLAGKEGPFVLAFNHGSMLDVVIAPLVLGRKARYPAAMGAMAAFGGRAGLLMSRWGAFSVDLENGHKALESSVQVLCSGDDANVIVLFPEAWTHLDGVVRKFKTGTVRMALEAGKKLGKPVPVIPGYMSYGRYPGSWITRLPIPVQWLIPMVFAFYYGRGVKVVIGDEIDVRQLSADVNEATSELRSRLIALNPRPAAS